MLTSAKINIEDLEQLQIDAAGLGLIHDPIFYVGQVDEETVLLGAIFQLVSADPQSAMIGALESFSGVIESLVPEDNPFERLVHFGFQLDFPELPEEEEANNEGDVTDDALS